MPKTPHSSRGPSRSGKGSERRVTQTGAMAAVERPASSQASKGSGGFRAPSRRTRRSPARRCEVPARDRLTVSRRRGPAYARRLVQLRNGIPMATQSPVQIPRQRIAELIEREEKQLNDATQRSQQTYER